MTTVLGALAFLSIALMLWQWWVAMRFPLHRRSNRRDFSPAVTLLKPLKGCDSETEKCLRSWLEQEYAGSIQILFGVANPQDPVCVLVRQLTREYPKVDAELVICSKQLGPNAKVSTLIHLERLAKHDILIVSDADVHAPRDLVAEIVQPLADAKTSLVNCFYRLAEAETFPMRLEAVAVNADFWSQVLQARSLKPIDFALGAVMAFRGKQLAAIGGFDGLVEYLADDYELGNRIARHGSRIEIAPVVVDCRSAPANWREVWNHQLRWARTIRGCRPVSYFFSILANATLWPLLFVLVHTVDFLRADFLAGTGRGWFTFQLYVFMVVMAFLPRVLTSVVLQKRLTESTDHYAWFYLAWVKDLLNVILWAAAFCGNTVTWRGTRYRLRPGGKLENVEQTRQR